MNGNRFLRPRRKVSAARLQMLLLDLVSDWVMLHTLMPRPLTAGTDGKRTSNALEYGHPAEWASDQTAKIADLLWSWHDMIADLRGETPPTPVLDDYGHRRREVAVVRAAADYLHPRADWILEGGRWLDFTELPVPWARKWDWTIDDDTFDELFDLHRQIRNSTGNGRPRYVLPLPCPSSECNLLTLERVAGMAGKDYIVCGACGHTVDEDNYPFLVRVLVEQLGPAAAKKVGVTR